MEGITQAMPQAVPVPQQQLLPYPLSAVSSGKSLGFPEDILTLSPAAMAIARQKQEGGPIEGSETSAQLGVGEKNQVSGSEECQTCSNRKYKDVSDDSSVSFQTPTRVAPGAAESQVRAHEQEHVTNEQTKAGQKGRKVVAQSVAIHYSVCSECGKSYVAGGTTTTITKSEQRQDYSEKDTPSRSAKSRINVYA